jgi:hypothetical protein
MVFTVFRVRDRGRFNPAWLEWFADLGLDGGGPCQRNGQ